MEGSSTGDIACNGTSARYVSHDSTTPAASARVSGTSPNHGKICPRSSTATSAMVSPGTSTTGTVESGAVSPTWSPWSSVVARASSAAYGVPAVAVPASSSMSASIFANSRSPTTGTPRSRAFFALRDIDETSAATTTRLRLHTPPTSSPASVARRDHSSRGIAIAPVNVTRSPGWSAMSASPPLRASSTSPASPVSRRTVVQEPNGSASHTAARARPIDNSSAMVNSRSRSSEVTTPSAHASTDTWRR